MDKNESNHFEKKYCYRQNTKGTGIEVYSILIKHSDPTLVGKERWVADVNKKDEAESLCYRLNQVATRIPPAIQLTTERPRGIQRKYSGR
ncbi:MAG: hypothetical protein KZQ97_13870 [Candidatus Thiodiazotropha sp. (ex Dulcina madagascariensis)]|nr:hypothetical protein [Candidatus Thiodiazotropha sp. (ex Dulcina madagascariensis)]